MNRFHNGNGNGNLNGNGNGNVNGNVNGNGNGNGSVNGNCNGNGNGNVMIVNHIYGIYHEARSYSQRQMKRGNNECGGSYRCV